MSGNCPDNLALHFRNCNIRDEGARWFSDALKQGNSPKGLKLIFTGNKLTDTAVQLFTDALDTRKCPENLHLDFSYSFVSEHSLPVIARALESGNCPDGLSIVFSNNGVGDVGAKILSNALKSGCCPHRLKLDLTYNGLNADNKIGNNGAVCFSEALESGNCPNGLELILTRNNVRIASCKAFALALQSDACPKDIKLTLDWQEDGVKYSRDRNPFLVGEYLSDAMKSICSVTNLVVTQYGNDDGDYRRHSIKHCCQRNKLLLEFKEYTSIILKLSSEMGLYIAPKNRLRGVPSLQQLAVQSIVKNEVSVMVPPGREIAEPLKAYIEHANMLVQVLTSGLPFDISQAKIVSENPVMDKVLNDLDKYIRTLEEADANKPSAIKYLLLDTFFKFNRKQTLEAANQLRRVIVHSECQSTLDQHAKAFNGGKLSELRKEIGRAHV